MRTWTATATLEAPPDAVLDVLTDPEACARWAPVDFDVEELDSHRLTPGTRARLSGRLAGVTVSFDVEVLTADEERLELHAAGPVALDVAYELAPTQEGSEVKASVGVRPGRGFRGRLLAEATTAVLKAGALHHSLRSVGREAASLCPA